MADLSQNEMERKGGLNILLDHSDHLISDIMHADHIHIFLDNAAMELLYDLILCKSILEETNCQVYLHFKNQPIFVSDVIDNDINMLLSFVRELGFEDWVESLLKLIERGQLQLHPDDFWNSPNFFTEMPHKIESQFAKNDVIISKGDANYRRFFEDREIPQSANPGDFTTYLPCPTYCVRTLKSEIQLGLVLKQIEGLNSTHPDWLVNGKFAVIQKIN